MTGPSAADGVGGEEDRGPGVVPARSTDPIVAKQQLEALMVAEVAATGSALTPMRAIVTRPEDAIGTVNPCLGRDEEIVLLRDGASALARTDQLAPVAAVHGRGRRGVRGRWRELTGRRRRVRRMAAGGPQPRRPGFPEPKGIVVLRPRGTWDATAKEPRRHRARRGEPPHRLAGAQRRAGVPDADAA